MRDTISRAEEDFRDALNDWDGDLEKVRGIKDRAGPLLKGSIKDLVAAQEEDEAPDAGAATCPVCGAPLGLGATDCPTCGTVVGTVGANEPAAVADEGKKEDR
jgi:hypothetical protein